MIPYGRAPKVYSLSETNRGAERDGTELLIVEGDSAAAALNQIRDPASQAVLALQGKPLNCKRARPQAILRNPTTARVLETLFEDHWQESLLGAGVSRTEPSHGKLADRPPIVFDTVCLVMDPDADGIHCSVLMMAFFQRIATEFIAQGRLKLIRAPMFLLSATPSMEPVPAMDPHHADSLEQQWRARGYNPIRKRFIRGLGSLNAELLQRFCMDPRTRVEETLTPTEVERAVAMFANA
ncbi:MAG: toprim domain-containing protein [Planctomycetota bacterium]